MGQEKCTSFAVRTRGVLYSEVFYIIRGSTIVMILLIRIGDNDDTRQLVVNNNNTLISKTIDMISLVKNS